jgi:hypothetical protein
MLTAKCACLLQVPEGVDASEHVVAQLSDVLLVLGQDVGGELGVGRVRHLELIVLPADSEQGRHLHVLGIELLQAQLAHRLKEDVVSRQLKNRS